MSSSSDLEFMVFLVHEFPMVFTRVALFIMSEETTPFIPKGY